MSDVAQNSTGISTPADRDSTVQSFGSVDIEPVEASNATSNEPSLTNSDAPAGWDELRGNVEIQFEPFMPINNVSEPSWFGEVLRSLFEVLAGVLAPIGGLLGAGMFAWTPEPVFFGS